MLARPSLCVSIVLLLASGLQAQTSLAWSATHDGASNAQQKTEVVGTAAFPGGGVVSVCMISEWMPGTPPFWLVKNVDVVHWDAGGNKLWATRLSGLGSNPTPKAIVVDAQGIVYTCVNQGYYAYTLVALDAAGAVLWSRAAPGGEGLEKMIAAPAGGVYIAGYDQSVDMAMRVTAWSATGVHRWTTPIQGPLGGGDFPNGIAIDPLGNVAVAGRFQHPTTSERHLAVAKLSSSGTLLWSRSLPGVPSTGLSIATAPNGDIVAGGEIEVVQNVSSAALVVRFDTNGTLLWSQAFVPTGTTFNSIQYLALTADGGVWGSGMGSLSNSLSMLVVHYLASGTPVLQYRHDPPGQEAVYPAGIILGGAGQVWIGASVSEHVTPLILNGYATLLQFDSGSALDWFVDFDLSAADGYEFFNRGFVLAEGNQLVMGGSSGYYQGDDALALAIDIGDSPRDYCVAKTNSIGCVPAMTFAGSSSASSAGGFVVIAGNEMNQKAGLILYSLAGDAAVPFQGGTLCLNVPVRRTPGGGSGGSALPALDCSGSYALDMNAFASGAAGGNPDPALSLPGATVWMQAWGRDPGFAAPNNTSLSNGLRYVVGP